MVIGTLDDPGRTRRNGSDRLDPGDVTADASLREPREPATDAQGRVADA